jgi:hypothetical protein
MLQQQQPCSTPDKENRNDDGGHTDTFKTEYSDGNRISEPFQTEQAPHVWDPGLNIKFYDRIWRHAG